MSCGHPEAGWFGYLYMWQCQPNGTVGTRLHMNDALSPSSRDWEWEPVITADPIGYDNPLPLEEDSWGILSDFYPHLYRVGQLEVRHGRSWMPNEPAAV